MIKIGLNRFFFILVLMVLFTSCSQKYKIEGSSSITSLDGKMLFLKVFQGDQLVTIDSAEIVHGLFSMQGVVDSTSLVSLYMDDEGIMPIVLERGKIAISISNTQLKAAGTPLNNRLYDFFEKQNDIEIQLEDLSHKEIQMVVNGTDYITVHEQLEKEQTALVEEMNEYGKTFIKDNYENVLGPYVFMMMCTALPYPIMTEEIEDIMRTAPMAFKENQAVSAFLSMAKENMQLIEEHKLVNQSVNASMGK